MEIFVVLEDSLEAVENSPLVMYIGDSEAMIAVEVPIELQEPILESIVNVLNFLSPLKPNGGMKLSDLIGKKVQVRTNVRKRARRN